MPVPGGVYVLPAIAKPAFRGSEAGLLDQAGATGTSATIGIWSGKPPCRSDA